MSASLVGSEMCIRDSAIARPTIVAPDSARTYATDRGTLAVQLARAIPHIAPRGCLPAAPLRSRAWGVLRCPGPASFPPRPNS
eukprot:11061455-Alexandrium_andersonii.AAC.1